MDIYSIVAVVISFLLGIGGTYKLVQKFFVPIKEVQQLIKVVLKATEDKKLTQEEIKIIVEEAKDIPEAIIAILNK